MARKSRKYQKSNDNFLTKNATFSAWIYARISNENSHADDSIDNQIAICKEYINSDSELIYSGVFTDLGYSGTDFERPGYIGMMAGILCGDVKCVIIKDLSRLGRTYIEVGELIFDTFVRYGIRFISVNDCYDSFSDDAGRKKLLIIFKNLVNQMYSRDLGKKVKSTHAIKKQWGEPIGLPPYGYYVSKYEKRLEINIDEANVVKLIFDMRTKGERISNIVSYLNRNHIPPPRNRNQLRGQIHNELLKQNLWSARTIGRILKNEIYMGSLIQGKYNCCGKKHTVLPKESWIINENKHPSIIDKAQFETVTQLMRESALKYSNEKRSTTTENCYSGKIVCSHCGKMAIRYKSRKSNSVEFYYCCRDCVNESKYKNGIKRAENLYLNKLDDIVMDYLGKCMDTHIQFVNAVEDLLKSEQFRRKEAYISRDVTELETTIGNHERNLSMAYTHHLTGLLDLREYKLIRDKLENEKLEAEAQLTKIRIDGARYDINNMRNNKWLVEFGKFKGFISPTKKMIQELINRIYLTPITNDIYIELNYMDSFEELQQLIQESRIRRSSVDEMFVNVDDISERRN